MYSLDFRKKVFKVGEEEKLSIRELAKRFGISSRTIVSWKQRLEPQLKRNRAATKLDMEALKKDIEENPNSYQHERAAKFKVSQSCIKWALKRLGVTYKKNSKTSESRRRKALYVPR